MSHTESLGTLSSLPAAAHLSLGVPAECQGPRASAECWEAGGECAACCARDSWSLSSLPLQGEKVQPPSGELTSQEKRRPLPVPQGAVEVKRPGLRRSRAWPPGSTVEETEERRVLEWENRAEGAQVPAWTCKRGSNLPGPGGEGLRGGSKGPWEGAHRRQSWRVRGGGPP